MWHKYKLEVTGLIFLAALALSLLVTGFKNHKELDEIFLGIENTLITIKSKKLLDCPRCHKLSRPFFCTNCGLLWK
jgi:hypothetical protein